MLASKQGLRFVLTGGGARLPMIQQLANGTMTSHGFGFERRSTQTVPDWITTQYPEFESEYPQLAVAMGGALPDLPSIRKEYEKFGGGLSHPTVVAGNLKITGN